jgi:hypothetical protein
MIDEINVDARIMQSPDDWEDEQERVFGPRPADPFAEYQGEEEYRGHGRPLRT